MRTALFGLEVSKFRDDKDEYPIMVRLGKDDREQIEKLLSLNVVYRDMNMGGALRQVPITSIGKYPLFDYIQPDQPAGPTPYRNIGVGRIARVQCQRDRRPDPNADRRYGSA